MAAAGPGDFRGTSCCVGSYVSTFVVGRHPPPGFGMKTCSEPFCVAASIVPRNCISGSEPFGEYAYGGDPSLCEPYGTNPVVDRKFRLGATSGSAGSSMFSRTLTAWQPAQMA